MDIFFLIFREPEKRVRKHYEDLESPDPDVRQKAHAELNARRNWFACGTDTQWLTQSLASQAAYVGEAATNCLAAATGEGKLEKVASAPRHFFAA